jgi:hypothetical protein
MNPRALKSAALAACVALVACSPALDWREVRPSGTRLLAMFPCKAVAQQRSVRLAGKAVVLRLQACAAGDRTWGVAHADIVDPTLLGAAMKELLAAAATNIGAQSPQIQPLQVPGATPHEASARAHLVGTRPDGQSVEMALAVFADGTRVFQVTLLGRRASGDDAASFFASLRVAP